MRRCASPFVISRTADFRTRPSIWVDEACSMVRVDSLSHVSGVPEQSRAQAKPVTGKTVARVVSRRTGIPVTELTGDGAGLYLDLESKLMKKIMGQGPCRPPGGRAAAAFSFGTAGRRPSHGGLFVHGPHRSGENLPGRTAGP